MMDPSHTIRQDRDLILMKMSRFRVLELQQVLGMLKLSKAGRKAELYERLKNLFYNSPQNIQVVKNAVDMIANRGLQSNPHMPYGMPVQRPVVTNAQPFSVNMGQNFMNPSFAHMPQFGRPAQPAPLVPSTPIQIPPHLAFEDLKPIATYSVGAGGLKPPIIFKLKFDASDLEKLQSIDPVTKIKSYRLILYSCLVGNPSQPALAPKLCFPDGLSISCNGVYAHVTFN